MKQNYLLGSAACLILAACGDAALETSDTVSKTIPTTESAERTDGYNANKNVYFGDLHIHTIDLTNCAPSIGTSDSELKAVWTDPNFALGESAAYYVRVLENPTCRWSTWDALKAGTEFHPDLPTTLKERAWSSPIWTSSE